MTMMLGMFTGRGPKAGESVTLNVMTAFNEGGGREKFVGAYQHYEEASGNRINDIRIYAVNEDWKKKVV